MLFSTIATGNTIILSSFQSGAGAFHQRNSSTILLKAKMMQSVKNQRKVRSTADHTTPYPAIKCNIINDAYEFVLMYSGSLRHIFFVPERPSLYIRATTHVPIAR